MDHLKPLFFGLVLGLLLAGGLTAYAAWSPPAEAPPNCASGNPGCDPPLTGSGTGEHLPYFVTPGKLGDSPLARAWDNNGTPGDTSDDTLVGLITDPGMGLAVDGEIATLGSITIGTNLKLHGDLTCANCIAAQELLLANAPADGLALVFNEATEGFRWALPSSEISFWGKSGDHIYNTNSGSVGIGTGNPLELLHISSNDFVKDAAIRLDAPTLAVGSQTFSSAGGTNWPVPAGVTSISVEMYGAEGANGELNIAGGKGGLITAKLAVTPFETLQVNVGFFGGQASDIRRDSNTNGTYELSERIVVAGGGGSGGLGSSPGVSSPGGYGGAGGGIIGGKGTGGGPTGGQGGSSSAGGAGGYLDAEDGMFYGNSGSFGFGGTGVTGGCHYIPGGRGGDGWYGGGAGGPSGGRYDCDEDSVVANGSGGGGGGSSYCDAAKGCSGAVHLSGVRSGNGFVRISWSFSSASWAMGVDTTDAKFKISPSGSLGVNDALLLDSVGNMTIKGDMCLQSGKCLNNIETSGGFYGYCAITYSIPDVCSAKAPATCVALGSCGCPSGFTLLQTGRWDSGGFTTTRWTCVKD